ncbi:O-antigen ligase family protein [Patescibacteria group bacterium]|nr:O-antigen ligase family protein [Patescibacteria group bacterium]
MFSSFLDPNFLGEFLALNFILAFGYTINYLKRNKIKLSLFLGFDFFLLAAIILTYSRSALVMLIIGMTIFFILYRLPKKYIFGFLALIIVFVLISPRAFKSEGTNFFREYSSMERLVSAGNALSIFARNPLIGIGFDAYRYAQIRYGFRTAKTAIISHADAGTDNSFLFVTATTGIAGLIAYVFMWLNILKLQALKINQKNKNLKLTGIVFISSALGLFIGSFFINSLFYPFIMEWVWVMASI